MPAEASHPAWTGRDFRGGADVEGGVEGTEAARLLRGQLDGTRGRSPLYERLLEGLSAAAERGEDDGAIARLLSTPVPGGVEEVRLLLLAAVHDAALRQSDLPHAAWFPTAVGQARRPDDGDLVGATIEYLVKHEIEVAAFLSSHRLQTNEVGRCVALLPGFLQAARFTLPLRLLEVGCSAGLLLRFDRFRYRYIGGPGWGPKNGPLLESAAAGAVPSSLLPESVEVAERRGIDHQPLDPGDPAEMRLLASFIWPDDRERHRRLRQAVAVARETPATLESGDLVAWAAEHVRPEEGTTTVVFHSFVLHLLDEVTAARFATAVDRALHGAAPGAPFVYLSLEPPPGAFDEARLTISAARGSGRPRTRTLLSSHPHGRWVRWW